jgi:stage V sporulation protein AE
MEKEQPGFGKAIGGAFIVGAVLVTIGQVFMVLLSHTPLYAAGFSTLALLVCMGILGSVLFLADIYPRLEGFGGMGAVLPFSGLASAVAGMTFNIGKEAGGPGKGAVVAIIEMGCKVVLLGTAICMVLGAVYYFSGFGTVFMAPYSPGGVLVEQVGPPNGTEAGPPNGVPVGVDPLAFLWAFLIGGTLCAIAQLILMLTKLPMGVFLVILFGVGAALTPFGVMKWLVMLGGAGCQVLILDAGEAVASTFAALLSGNPLPFISILCLFVILFAMGIATGFIKTAMTKSKDVGPTD